MEKIVYIQYNPGNLPINENAYKAREGFYSLGYEPRAFKLYEMSDLPLSRETIVHGNVNAVRASLRLLKIPIPESLSFIEGVFYGRRSWKTTLGEIRTLKDVPVFIKPLETQKLFTGHVIQEFKDLIQTSGLLDETRVLAQETVEFKSEWRVFVHDCEIKNVSHYQGNPICFPDMGIAYQTIANFDWKLPVAYSIDLGVLGNETVVVEINDSFALGSYGLSSIPYAQMIEARWQELVSQC